MGTRVNKDKDSLRQKYLGEYEIWSDMKRRCYSKTRNAYKWYGAKGVTVSDEWRNSFNSFIEDMGARPSKKHTIDRINNNEGYSKSNCKWATWEEQFANRSNTVYLEHNGITKTMKEWAIHLNIRYPLFRDAVVRYKTIECLCNNYKDGILKQRLSHTELFN